MIGYHFIHHFTFINNLSNVILKAERQRVKNEIVKFKS